MSRYEKAIKKRLQNLFDRKLVLCGDDYFTDYIFEELKKLNISVAGRLLWKDKDYFVEDDLEKDVSLLNHKEYFILAAAYSNHKEIYERIVRLGFEYNKDFSIMNVGGYTKPITAIDPLLCYCRSGDTVSQYDVIGDGKLKIAVYGGSTSENEKGGEKCWSSFLHDYLESQKIRCTIYNGAVSGYSSGQELLKLLRDVLILKPDIVISFSGINDIDYGTHVKGHNFLNRFQKRMWENIIDMEGTIPDSMDMRNMRTLEYGIEDCENPDYVIWMNNERMMYAICKEFKIDFIGCLEPMIARGYEIEADLMELIENNGIKESLFKNQNMFVDHLKERIGKYPYIVDMSDILSGCSDCYMDHVHCNEKGNRKIALKIGEMVQKKVK